MDLCHSVEIFIYSLLGCSGKIFLLLLWAKINHVIAFCIKLTNVTFTVKICLVLNENCEFYSVSYC